MVEFICVYCMRDFIADGCSVHIEPLELILSGSVLTHAYKLNSADTRILACVFCKALSFSKVILEIRTVRLKDINHISHTVVFPDNDEVRIGRPDFTVYLVRNAERPRSSGWITNPADKVRTLFFRLYKLGLPAIQFQLCCPGRFANKEVVSVFLATRLVRNLYGLRQTEVMLADGIAVRNDASFFIGWDRIALPKIGVILSSATSRMQRIYLLFW